MGGKGRGERRMRTERERAIRWDDRLTVSGVNEENTAAQPSIFYTYTLSLWKIIKY